MQKAVFLDRDGVINENCSRLDSVDKYKMFKGVPNAIKKLNDAGFLVIVVTNQPDIAKGFFTFAKLEEIHEHMRKMLAKAGAHVDALYICPHYPEKGFEREIPELKIDCNCR
ncbi:HAD-IIIA family hydrolase, partial [Candidatus Woesearchaeota archaeon]|nr:HAD-IIIA family hydrolase [Candidatus Woesearchaeota archaeon]